MKRKSNIFENIVMLLILLVIVQTLLEDLFILAGSSWSARKVLVFTGFFFDLFFTIEFLIRMYDAIFYGNVKKYIIEKRGWIDFAASIPLLLLNSGPSAYALIVGTSFAFGGAGIVNLLKVVKIIRIARILRLLRVLKIFKQIKYADSKMAQHHVTKITSISISSLVFILLLFSMFASIIKLPQIEAENSAQNRSEAENIVYKAEGDIKDIIHNYTLINDTVLRVTYRDEVIFSRYDSSVLNQMFSPDELDYIGNIKNGDFTFLYNAKSVSLVQARDNIQYFILVLCLVLIFMFYYSPHFAINVSDPIMVMQKGFKEKNYSLEVRIQEKYKDQEVFTLAESYNENYLPMKARETHNDSAPEELDLKLDDVKNLLDEGFE